MRLGDEEGIVGQVGGAGRRLQPPPGAPAISWRSLLSLHGLQQPCHSAGKGWGGRCRLASDRLALRRILAVRRLRARLLEGLPLPLSRGETHRGRQHGQTGWGPRCVPRSAPSSGFRIVLKRTPRVADRSCAEVSAGVGKCRPSRSESWHSGKAKGKPLSASRHE